MLNKLCYVLFVCAVTGMQVSQEGEVALRLGLTVMAAPMPQPGSSSSRVSQQQLQHLEPHVFELGVHLNLSQLIGTPSLQHADELFAERSGLNGAARGVLLIGDLGLDADDMAEMPWRAPHLGIGVLPVAPLQLQGSGPAVAEDATATDSASDSDGKCGSSSSTKCKGVRESSRGRGKR